ncbi:hypothetical protein [Shimia sp.]
MADAVPATKEVVSADPSKAPAKKTSKKTQKEDPRGRKVTRNGFTFWLKD